MRLPTRLDRYPAKMVSKLADSLLDRYALDAESVLDPFCGSGAVLLAARRRGVAATGVDVNPVASLFSRVKLCGFRAKSARSLAERWVTLAAQTKNVNPVAWDAKDFWFTSGTIHKFEQLRAAGHCLSLSTNTDGLAVLLSYTLSVRLCSRADQRSPKPFISKSARASRLRRHFDPFRMLVELTDELSALYAHFSGTDPAPECSRFVLADVASESDVVARVGRHTHVITSPPYINAQDYFRNFKLELYLLEGLLPFRVTDIKERFIGTERGELLRDIPPRRLAENRQVCPELHRLEGLSNRQSAIVHRYLSDMNKSFYVVRKCLRPGGSLVLVCGDNLVGGIRLRTWKVLQRMLERSDFQVFDRFVDPIGNRLLAPTRLGHKGLIKEEVVTAFEMC